MKNIFKYINLLVVILLLTSCEKFLDVNVDPNNPTEVSPDLVLPVAQKYSANIIQGSDAGGRRANTVGNMLMYNWSQSDGFAWYPDEFKYNVTSSFYQLIFNDSYNSALKQYQILSQLEAGINDNYIAIGMIMKAYHFQLLVDFYGDVPYTEALLRKENATPVYDDAAAIYADLQVQLTAASALIANAEAIALVPGEDDAMFGGDMDSWISFANTLKLRIAVRESNATDIASIMAEGNFITDDVMVNPGYAVEENKQNPFWNLYGWDASAVANMTHNATCATDYIIEYLTNTNDPRIDYLYAEPATGHLGVPQGLLDYDTPVKDAYIFANVSLIGPGLLKAGTQGAVIFSLAESYFNQAEAKLPSGDAQALYEKGIQASFDYLGAPDAAAYYAQGVKNVAWGASVNKLEAIITQKWLAVNGITAEQSWFDYSRTGFPSDLPVPLNQSKTERPVRLFYPAGELSANGANVPAQPDAFTAKIFWAN